MKKRTINILLSLILTAALTAGCGAAKETTPAETPKNGTTAAETQEPGTAPGGDVKPEKLMEIVDKDGRRLGEIDANSACSAVDGGIFYSVVEMKEYALTGTARYHFFRASDGKDIFLGTVEEQSYETFYARTELGGVIYTLASQGDVVDDKPDALWLLAFDPAAETMTKYEVTKYGFPYAAMTAVGGKLLIMNHEMSSPKCDKIYEFDPAAKTVREILSFPDDGKSSLRSIAAAEDGFYLLRIRLAGGLPEEMLLDRYDGAGRLQETVSLNEMIIPAMKDMPGFAGEDDVLVEFGMYASGFAVQDGRYLFYENFGRVRVIADLETGEALFAEEDLWNMSNGSGEPAFFEVAFEPYGAGEGPKTVYVQDGKVQKLSFGQEDSKLLLRSVSRSADGTWLIRMASADGGEKLVLRKD